MEKVYLIKNGTIVHTSKPELFLEDGWTHHHKNPEAKKASREKIWQKEKNFKIKKERL